MKTEDTVDPHCILGIFMRYLNINHMESDDLRVGMDRILQLPFTSDSEYLSDCGFILFGHNISSSKLKCYWQPDHKRKLKETDKLCV